MPLTVASRITIFRILLIPFFIATVLYYQPRSDFFRFVALGIFLTAAFSDLLDGYIARRFQQTSDVGAMLDPLADKVLLMSAFICLYKVGIHFEAIRFPVWLVVAVISRDVMLLIGSAVIQLIHGKFKVQPTPWGKLNTFVQACCIVGVLLQWPYSVIFWYITLVLTIVTGIDYLRKGFNILYGEKIA